MKHKICTFAFALVFATLSHSVGIAGEKFTGKWTGGASTSLEIVSVEPIIVIYCFGGRCNKYSPNGDINKMSLIFPKTENFPGANWSMEKSGNSYKGLYKENGSTKVFRATLR